MSLDMPIYSYQEIKDMGCGGRVYDAEYDLATIFNKKCLDKLGFYNPILDIVAIRGSSGIFSYIGVDAECSIAHRGVNDFDFNVNGGLTFAGTRCTSDEYFYYGWDYCHIWDKRFDESLNEETAINAYPNEFMRDFKRAIIGIACLIAKSEV